MKYLKYFESINDNLKPNDFDTECLEEVKSIFNEFAEENDFYQFDWTLDSSPQEVGIHYTYFTWIELENQPNENKNKWSCKIMDDMLTTKYFDIQVYINEEPDNWILDNDSQFDDIIQKINDNFIKRIETLGYKVKISNVSMSSNDIWTDQIILKIDYSEA